MNFGEEVKYIKAKFLQVDYPLHFWDSFIRNVQSTISAMDVKDLFIIQPSLFDECKPFVFSWYYSFGMLIFFV